jgi:hypothetical protein
VDPRTVLNYSTITLHCTASFSTALHHTASHHATLQRIILHHTFPNSYRTAPHRTALHLTAFYFTALHRTAPFFWTFLTKDSDCIPFSFPFGHILLDPHHWHTIPKITSGSKNPVRLSQDQFSCQ